MTGICNPHHTCWLVKASQTSYFWFGQYDAILQLAEMICRSYKFNNKSSKNWLRGKIYRRPPYMIRRNQAFPYFPSPIQYIFVGFIPNNKQFQHQNLPKHEYQIWEVLIPKYGWIWAIILPATSPTNRHGIQNSHSIVLPFRQKTNQRTASASA